MHIHYSGGSRILYGRVAKWPKKISRRAAPRKVFSPCRGSGGLPQKILKMECLRLAKNAFLAIERSQISSKISAVC